jgi:biofilm PGA synthesis lipoprotein PgaB
MRWLLIVLFLSMSAIADEPSFQVISYHDIRDDVAGDFDADQYAVSTRNLIEQFTWLRDNDFHPVSVDAIIAAYEEGRQLPPNAVLLTFDDGLASFYTHVYPLLRVFHYPAVVSVVSSWIESEAVVDYVGIKRQAGDFLSWEQLREMQDSGLVEIASHSHDLHKGIRGNPQNNMQPAATTRLYDDEQYETETAYVERIRRDLSLSVETIHENTGHKPQVITWPYGALNDAAADVAAELGMRISLTLAPETEIRNDTLRIGRYLVVGNPVLAYFSAELMLEQPARIVRVAQVDLDYVYDSDPDQQSRNLDRLLDRIKAMEISHVFLQAYADDDADGGADALYFPNRHLPMRADLFNRVAWQLKTRSNVRVFAWLPMLSFVGGPFDPEWRVQQHDGTHITPDPNAEPRLSPFSSKARELIGDIYEDLATYAKFDGLLFHDDGRLNEFEDFSAPAMNAYREIFGTTIEPEKLNADPELAQRWSAVKTQVLIDFSKELVERVLPYHPDLQTARNIFASALLDEQATSYLAQDYELYLKTYDFVALMAMPALEGAADEKRFFERLVQAASDRDGGLERTIFELQTVDWNESQPIDSLKIRQTMRWLQSLGVRHLGYYPDDFISGRPRLEDVRSGMSLADEYGEVLP